MNTHPLQGMLAILVHGAIAPVEGAMELFRDTVVLIDLPVESDVCADLTVSGLVSAMLHAGPAMDLPVARCGRSEAGVRLQSFPNSSAESLCSTERIFGVEDCGRSRSQMVESTRASLRPLELQRERLPAESPLTEAPCGICIA